MTMANFVDGTMADSSFKTIIRYPGTPEHVRQTLSSLYHKYYPIERDTSMHVREKMKHLEDWWHSDLTAFVSSGYTSADFALMTMQSKLLFRKGVSDLI